jgi:hypothetical protein
MSRTSAGSLRRCLIIATSWPAPSRIKSAVRDSLQLNIYDYCVLDVSAALGSLVGMADPFSITAGAFSVVGFTLQSITALLEDIHAIKNAPKAIADLQKELSTAETVLATLDSELQGSTLEILSPNAKVILSLATTNCKRACDKFRTKLQKWTKHSTDDAIHWWDRVRIGLFAEAEVEVLSEQVRKCKDDVRVAIGTATLYVPVTLFLIYQVVPQY